MPIGKLILIQILFYLIKNISLVGLANPGISSYLGVESFHDELLIFMWQSGITSKPARLIR
jgi:hypothetical protein